MIDGHIRRAVALVAFATLILGIASATAQAQTKLVKPASGGTIRITKSGSYFLGSNLVSGLKAAPVIGVAVNNVTINLNGFSIIGVGGPGTGIGINAAGFSGVVIVNGTITKIPGKGVVLGSSSTVAGVQIIDNTGDGIDCASACLILGDIITGNGGTGLNFSDKSSGYQDNILSNLVNVSGGTNLGHNVCDTGLCPP